MSAEDAYIHVGSRTKMDAMDAIREEVSCPCTAAYLIGRLIAELDTTQLVNLAEELEAWHLLHAENCDGHGPASRQ